MFTPGFQIGLSTSGARVHKTRIVDIAAPGYDQAGMLFGAGF